MATCSSILAWEIPRTEEPGSLQSKGSHTIEQPSTHARIRKTIIVQKQDNNGTIILHRINAEHLVLPIFPL